MTKRIEKDQELFINYDDPMPTPKRIRKKEKVATVVTSGNSKKRKAAKQGKPVAKKSK